MEARNGPSSRQKSSIASGSEYARAGTDQDNKQPRIKSQFSRDRRELNEELKRSSQYNKSSMQDVLSEFFYSCGGKSAFEYDRSSKHSARDTPEKHGRAVEEISFHKLSDYEDADDDEDEGD